MSQALAEVPATVSEQGKSSSGRFWEVDSWRGVAIVMMVIFHFVYDLRVFVGMPIDLLSGFWFYFQRITATSFILLVGISLAISYNRAVRKSGGTDGLFLKFLKRGVKILAIAMVFTLVIRFGGFGRLDYGVLHLIGTSIILAYPFLSNRWLALGTAAILFPLSYYVETITVNTLALVWLGFTPVDYYPMDYFPLIHWFAVVLLGVFIGQTLYAGGRRQFALWNLGSFFPLNVLQFLGRHSLVIYVIHQPILVGILIAIGAASL